MIWLNGVIENPQTGATSAGNLLGWGVFTTIGVRNGAPLWLQKHLARLQRDAALCEIALDFSPLQIETGLQATLSAHSIQNGLARLTLTKRGDGRWNAQKGSDLTILAHEAPICEAPLRVNCGFHPHSRHHPLRGAKTTSYLPFSVLGKGAKARGFDEILLHDEAKILVEAARATPFWAKNGELFTPSLENGGLNGVGRAVALDWAAKNGISVREGEFLVAELENAEEAFLISGANGPRALESLDFGGQTRFESGDFCLKLRAFWRDAGL